MCEGVGVDSAPLVAAAVARSAHALLHPTAPAHPLLCCPPWLPRRPLRAVGGPPTLMPAPGACLALAVWTQVTVAFILPTAVLLALQHRRQRARRSAATPAASQAPPQPAVQPLAATAASAQEPRGGRLRPPNLALLDSGDDEWSIPAVSCFAAQMMWLLLRVTMHDASA